MEKADYELKYDEFWKDIIEKDGVVNLDQVKRELYDFLQMMKNAGKVYCHVTCGQISKPNTNADAVIATHDEFRSEEIKQAIAEEIEEAIELSPGSIITKIRSSFSHATVVYTRGSCGQLYKILKEIFPDAEAYENGDHVITKIGDKFWDIKGEVERTQGFKLCEPNNALLSNYFGNDLQHIQCPNCDEVFYCGDEDEKDNACAQQ